MKNCFEELHYFLLLLWQVYTGVTSKSNHSVYQQIIVSSPKKNLNYKQIMLQEDDFFGREEGCRAEITKDVEQTKKDNALF